MFQPAKRALGTAAVLAGLALGGAALADAATSQGTTGPTGSTGSTPPAHPAFNGPAPGTAAHEDAETAVTGANAAKAQAAAVKAVGGGTAGAVTSDYTHSGYETTVTKSDGTKVQVHLDSSFQALPGPGAGHPGHPGPPPGV